MEKGEICKLTKSYRVYLDPEFLGYEDEIVDQFNEKRNEHLKAIGLNGVLTFKIREFTGKAEANRIKWLNTRINEDEKREDEGEDYIPLEDLAPFTIESIQDYRRTPQDKMKEVTLTSNTLMRLGKVLAWSIALNRRQAKYQGMKVKDLKPSDASVLMKATVMEILEPMIQKAIEKRDEAEDLEIAEANKAAKKEAEEKTKEKQKNKDQKGEK